MAGKYVKQIDLQKCEASWWTSKCLVVNYQTAANIAWEADQETDDLKAKALRMAKAVLEYDGEAGDNFCYRCDTTYLGIGHSHAPDCPVTEAQQLIEEAGE